MNDANDGEEKSAKKKLTKGECEAWIAMVLALIAKGVSAEGAAYDAKCAIRVRREGIF